MNNKIYKIMMIIMLVIVVLTYNTKVYADDELSVNAKAALIVEINTGKIIYEKDIYEQNYPASVTKILTAILTLENCELDDVATVSQTAISHIPTGYVVAPLLEGEKIKVEDLLYALMLKSSNDSAYVLAEYVGGSVEGFSEMMNKKAKDIGCKNSHFVNPNGIHNDNHYTTAYDMYLIAKYAMKNEKFVKIVSTYQYTLPATNKYRKNDRIMKNTNNFVNPKNVYYNEIVKGIKTGTTKQAGNYLITDSSDNGLEFITVVLGAQTANSKFSETKEMISFAYDNYKLTELHKKGDIIQNIEVKKATKKTKDLNLVISDDITAMANKKIKVDEIEPEIVLNENIKAPIEQGKELGIIKYNVDGLEYEAKLLAETEVELKTYYVEVAIGTGIVIIVLGIALMIRKKKKNKKHIQYNGV